MSTQKLPLPSSAISSRDQVIKSNKIKRNSNNYKNKLIKSKIEFSKTLMSLEKKKHENEVMKIQINQLKKELEDIKKKPVKMKEIIPTKIINKCSSKFVQFQPKPSVPTTDIIVTKCINPLIEIHHSLHLIKKMKRERLQKEKDSKQQTESRKTLSAQTNNIMVFISICFPLIILLVGCIELFIKSKQEEVEVDVVISQDDSDRLYLTFETCMQNAYACLRRRKK